MYCLIVRRGRGECGALGNRGEACKVRRAWTIHRSAAQCICWGGRVRRSAYQVGQAVAGHAAAFAAETKRMTERAPVAVKRASAPRTAHRGGSPGPIRHTAGVSAVAAWK